MTIKETQPAENTYFDLVPFVLKVFILFLFWFYFWYFLLCSVADLSLFFSLALLFYFCWYNKEYEGTENISDQNDEKNSTWSFLFHESGRFLLKWFFSVWMHFFL